MAMIYAFVAFCLFSGTLAQRPETSSCPQVEAVSDFDISRALGRWYEAERYFSAFEIGSKCIRVDISRGENNALVVNATRFSSLSGSPTSTNVDTNIPDSTKPGKLHVKYSSPLLTQEFDLLVLGTDYDKYVVLYSCVNVGLRNVKFAWILTRDQHPANSVIAEAHEVVVKKNLSLSSFSETERWGCEEKSPFE